MKLTKHDWGFMTIIGAFLAILLVNTGRVKPRNVPSDDKHRPLFNAMASGENREEVEKKCASCHNSLVVPLPKNHPPKEQCLLCHARSG
jgi:cytochrome c5